MDYIISEIVKQNPLHGKKLRKTLSGLTESDRKKAEKILEKYSALLSKQNRDINFGIDCYLKVCNDLMYESIGFMNTGKYSSTSFDEVNKRVYGNPDIMEYYMHGLLMSQVLWKHHYIMYEFFVNTFPKYAANVEKYLEIGGGHGLFVSEAIGILSPSAQIDLIDISQSSIDMARELINNSRVNYILQDIFTFERENTYDFITMGEVLEHVEDPLSLLKRLKSLLKKGGVAYITTPTNSPAIDHIYLFKNSQDIRDLIYNAGFSIKEETVLCSEDMPEEEANKNKITLLYAAFIQ